MATGFIGALPLLPGGVAASQDILFSKHDCRSCSAEWIFSESFGALCRGFLSRGDRRGLTADSTSATFCDSTELLVGPVFAA